jgi:WD40 repeat protein
MRLSSLLVMIAFLALAEDRPARGDPPDMPGSKVASLGTVPFWADSNYNIAAVAFSPDGKLLASGSSNGKVHLWDVATGKEIRRIDAHSEAVMGVAFSPDGRRLASRSHGYPQGGTQLQNNSICLWDVSTGKELMRFGAVGMEQIAALPSFPNWAFVVAFSPDGKLLASRSGSAEDGDSLVHLWDAATGKMVRQLDGHHQRVTAFAFSPDGKTLVSGSRDQTIRLWDVASGKELRQIGKPASGVTAVAFAPDGRSIAIACRDKTARLCSTATGKELDRFSAESEIRSVAFAPDGKTLAWGEWESIHLWSLETRKEVRRLPGNQRHVVSLVFSPDGKLLASVGEGQDRYVHVCEPATGRRLSPVLEGFGEGGLVSMSFSPDGRRLATTGVSGIVRLWDVAAGTELSRDNQQKPVSRGGLLLSPDGKLLASSGTAGSIRLRESATGKELRHIPVMDHISGMGFSPDSKLLAAGLSSGDVLVWNPVSGEQVLQVYGHRSPYSLSFSSDAKLLAVGDGAHIRIWDMATGKRLRRVGEPNISINQIAFSPTSNILASNYTTRQGTHVCFLDPVSGTKLWALDESALQPEETRVAMMSSRMVFSPDGRMVVTGRARPLVWEVNTGRLRCRLGEGPRGIGPVVFAPDSCILAVAGADNLIVFQDLTGRDRLQSGQRADLNAAQRERLWAALADSDAGAAYEAMLTLIAAPKQAVSLVKEQVRPTAKPDETQLARLITDLNDKRFAVRDKARIELDRLEETAVPALRRALKEPQSLEARRRLEKLLEELTGLQVSGERLRNLRAVEVLERIGTAEARKLLQTIAEGTPGARLTREARAALQRLAKQPASAP